MPHASDYLRAIHNFDDLVLYLEEKLGWPLQEYGFDDLTFQYEPEELGLKEEDAAKVKAIHQLRPLQHGQPWGIFFVEFEKKKLPVVVLRRILSHLVIKKRASANKAKEAAWHAEDLLFVTAFGEEDSDLREIAFAHFHQSPGDLPTLRVLGWDGGDTPLKLSHLDSVLRQRLQWPDDTTDHAAWRQQWRAPFKHRIGHVIRTADALAEVLASLARGINDKAKRMLAVESDSGPLRKLHKAFQVALIHDLTEENFADTYAQTITYGLLTAAISRTEGSEGRNGTFIIAENVTDMVPVTNPFLKEMLQTFLKVGGRKGGIDFDELGIQDVVDLLRGDETDLPAILRDFGNKTQGEDPVIHFYEHFLAAYNKKLKVQRGVFYTPKPVVSYIVRSVHELLQTEFGLEDGLASTITWGEMKQKHPEIRIPSGTSPNTFFVMVLDPATGTATFLVEVIDVIYKTMTAKWQKQGKREQEIVNLWNEYVPKKLLPRLYGYELMMAPYAIAHMKIGLKLFETGYQFMSEERVRVYLTNALEPASDDQQKLVGIVPALAHEAEAVNAVKRNIRFTVVVGNPPYAVEGANKNPWIDRLMDSYRTDVRNEFNIQLLSDDYAKFIRFANNVISTTSQGLIAMITKNTYINTTAFRGLRKCLQTEFSKVSVLDLHGKLYEKTPDGDPDTNVFEIRVGVAILFTILSNNEQRQASFQHSELFGSGETKLDLLSKISWSNTDWSKVTIDNDQWIMQPLACGEPELEYAKYCALLDLAICADGEQGKLWGGGVKTNRDFLLVAFTKAEIESRLTLLSDSNIATNEVKKALELTDGPYWNTERERKKLYSIDWKSRCFPYLYGPFDIRWVAHIPPLIEIGRGGASKHVMSHFQTLKNVGLILKRRNLDDHYHHVFVTRYTSDINTLSGQTYTIPLLLAGNSNLLFSQHDVSSSNFVEGSKLAKSILKTSEDIQPQEIFQYIYGTLHSHIYRSRYGGELRKEFPRVPLTSSMELFRSLAILGGELVALHLLESTKINDFITTFAGKGDNSIPKKPTWKENAVWINPTQRFEGVSENVWNFHIGGYQVCEKWLKDRKGRTLSNEDITHYQRIVVALNETIRLMAEIDKVIDEHGGWPIK